MQKGKWMKSNCLKRFSYKALFVLSSTILSFCYATFLTAESATAKLIKTTELKEGPDFSSDVVTTLKKNALVSLLIRKGGWYQVKTSKGEKAWLTMLSVRFTPMKKNRQKSSANTFVSLRQGHSNVTATTGVRGIGESDIKKAKPDFEGLKRGEKFAVSYKTAQVFAEEVSLKAQTINYPEKSHE